MPGPKIYRLSRFSPKPGPTARAKQLPNKRQGCLERETNGKFKDVCPSKLSTYHTYIYICNIHVYIMYIFYHIKKDIYIYIHTYTYAYTISMYKCSIPQPFGAHSCDTTESSWMAVSAKTSASRDSALVVSTFRGSWKALRMGVLRAINGFYHQEWCKNWDVTKHGALP